MLHFSKKNTPYAAAVIAAAGLSTRMGEEKLFAELGGAPVLQRTLEVFEDSDRISEIVLVAREEQMPLLYNAVRDWSITKVKTIVAGGKTRQESVYNGVKAVDCKAELICIHDAARPFVTPELITSVLDAASVYGAATAAVPTKNTIKVADENGFVVSTPDRSTLWDIQTPQCFGRETYLAAAERAPDGCTDDCQVVEAAGKRVKLVMGDYKNIKLTTPEDLLTAQIFWEERQ